MCYYVHITGLVVLVHNFDLSSIIIRFHANLVKGVWVTVIFRYTKHVVITVYRGDVLYVIIRIVNKRECARDLTVMVRWIAGSKERM